VRVRVAILRVNQSKTDQPIFNENTNQSASLNFASSAIDQSIELKYKSIIGYPLEQNK